MKGMPCTTIDVRTQYTAQQENALIEAVHAALVVAFKIPPHDKNIRLVVHAPHRFACPPTATHPGAYTHVTIDAFVGRSLDAKRQLYRAVVDNLAPLGIPPDHVMILIRESPTENWGIRGGFAACDVDLGFKVEI